MSAPVDVFHCSSPVEAIHQSKLKPEKYPSFNPSVILQDSSEGLHITSLSSYFETMYAALVQLFAAAVMLWHLVIQPLYNYFRDLKGFRRYPAINWIAGISNIGFMYEAYKGSRSQRLAKMHKVHPVIRLGPNSLSYRGGQAIKVR